jgi:1-acyl-sn-glycerol-3-phosphate acyltransferase
MNDPQAGDLAARTICVGGSVARRGNAFSLWLGSAILKAGGWRLQGEIPDLPKMVLIGAPHTSNMDGVMAMATLTALGLRCGTMIKDSAFKGPLGSVLRWFGAIPINRRTAGGVIGQSVDAFASADNLLLLIAPEGTRTSAPEWKKGFWLIAAGAKVPVLPAAIDYSKKRITFGPPLTPTGDFDADMSTLMAFYGAYGDPRHATRASAPICGALGLKFNGGVSGAAA